MDEAKTPGLSVDGWAQPVELAAVDEFTRVRPFNEVMRWRDYADFWTGQVIGVGWRLRARSRSDMSRDGTFGHVGCRCVPAIIAS